jgi:hypothetical protein
MPNDDPHLQTVPQQIVNKRIDVTLILLFRVLKNNFIQEQLLVNAIFGHACSVLRKAIQILQFVLG